MNKIFSWTGVANRLKLEAERRLNNSKRDNFAMISVTIFVDSQCRPIGWSAPEMRRLEPQGDWIMGTGIPLPLDVDTEEQT